MKNKIILAGLTSFILVPSLAFAEAAQGKIEVDQNPGGREMVMPGDNVAVGKEKSKALEAFVNARATDPTNSDGDGYGDARIREGGHTIGAGQVTEIVKGIDGHHGENGDNMPPEKRIKKQEGTITIMKRLPDHSLEVIELRMKTGTVKFFNEAKSVGGKVVNVIKGPKI